MRALLLATLAGCIEPKDDDAIVGLELSLGEVQTVVRARWETDVATRGEVVARFDGQELVVTEEEATTSHEVLLVGIPALTDVDVEIADAEDLEGTIRTGPLPPWVPDFDFVAEGGESEGGFRIAPVITAAGGGVLALDDLGRVVWSWPPSDEASPSTPFRARLSLDGRAVVFNGPAISVEDPGVVWRVPFDGVEPRGTTIDGIHTDFVEYTDGGYAALSWDIRDVGDGRRLIGTSIVEVPPGGERRQLWSAWDDFAPDLDQTYPSLYPDDPTVEDWTHINSLSYDAATDSYYATMTWNNALLRIDRQSGALVWSLTDFGGGDFDNLDGRARFGMPHSVQRVGDTLTVFSRGNPAEPSTCSSVVDLAIDEARGESRETWTHSARDCLLVTFLGSAERLPGGNTLVAWTTAGRLTEVTPAGEVAWQVSTPLGAAIGFSEQVPRLGY